MRHARRPLPAFALALLGCAPVPRETPPLASPDAGPARHCGDHAAAFGPLAVSDPPPPPLTGGTLLVARDGLTAVAADPELDLLSIVDLPSRTVRASLTLQRGDEPGRLAEDGAGRVHLVLRRSGALLTVDLSAARIIGRRPACPSPRGIAWDSRLDALHVACAGGELVTLPAAGGPALRSLQFDRDLRDVVVDGDRLLVSRFRSAELLTIAADGTLSGRAAPPPFGSAQVRDGEVFDPAVAWRSVPLPGGGAAMIHQRASASLIRVAAPMNAPPPTDAYGPTPTPCPSGIVHSAVTLFRRDAAPTRATALPLAVLPIDLAVTDADYLNTRNSDVDSTSVGHGGPRPTGTRLEGAILAPANHAIGAAQLFRVRLDGINPFDCATATPHQLDAQPIAVAYSATDLVVQTRAPATLRLLFGRITIPLSDERRVDTGHQIFHSNVGGLLACASCHPEGGDDGLTWHFDTGTRRTQSLRGGVIPTAPFHWNGEMPDLSILLADVFARRMSGFPLGCDQVDALSHWLDSIPLLPTAPPPDPAAVARGRARFTDPKVDGASCHTGPLLTSNLSADVGTGGRFQVPSLRGLADRAPHLHDGCAPTIRGRFGGCGGGDLHGHTSQLAPSELDDLVAYLSSL